MPALLLKYAQKIVSQKLATAESRKIFSNISWLTADRLLRMVLGFSIGVWLARYLGPSEYGMYSYIIAFTSMFGVIATLGLDSIVVRELVNHPELQRKILATTFAIKLIAAIGTILLTVTASYLIHSTNLRINILIAIASIGFLFQAWDTLDFWFQSQVQSRFTVCAKSSAFILISFYRVALILTKAPLFTFVLASVIELCIGAILLSVIYIKKGLNIKIKHLNNSTALQLLKDGAPLVFSGFLIMIYMRIDQIMIAQLVSDVELGYYSVAVKITEVWYLIPSVIVPSIFPSLLNSKQMSERLFYSRLQRLYSIMALGAYIVSVPVTLLSPWLINTFFGNSYQDSIPMLAILIWTTLFVSLGVARSSFLTAMNWTGLHFVTITIGCAINILLNILLIPHLGGIGAATATLISYGFATYLSCFTVKRLVKTGIMITKSFFLII